MSESHRERVVAAVAKLIDDALPNARVRRNVEKPKRSEPGGLVIVHDGDPGEPEVDLSPATKNYFHRIPVEVMAWDSAAPEDLPKVLDALLRPIGAAVAADRTLGGLCNYLQVEAPEIDDVDQYGAETTRWADLDIVAEYATTDPLN